MNNKAAEIFVIFKTVAKMIERARTIKNITTTYCIRELSKNLAVVEGNGKSDF